MKLLGLDRLQSVASAKQGSYEQLNHMTTDQWWINSKSFSFGAEASSFGREDDEEEGPSLLLTRPFSPPSHCASVPNHNPNQQWDGAQWGEKGRVWGYNGNGAR